MLHKLYNTLFITFTCTVYDVKITLPEKLKIFNIHATFLILVLVSNIATCKFSLFGKLSDGIHFFVCDWTKVVT